VVFFAFVVVVLTTLIGDDWPVVPVLLTVVTVVVERWAAACSLLFGEFIHHSRCCRSSWRFVVRWVYLLFVVDCLLRAIR
jgi:hypothetical protein